MSISHPPISAPSLRVVLGPAGSQGLSPGLPLLGGAAVEALFPGAGAARQRGALSVQESGEWLLGHAVAPAGEALEDSAHRLYRDLLAAVGGRHLARVWNYVPAINGHRADGLENYRAFCRGRAAAFEAAWGPGYKAGVPAASAVGSQGPNLAVVFAATGAPARHVENPAQVPAYDYPPEHGPRSPSFARATVVTAAANTAHVFVSGTAAIRGHATCAPDDTAQQLACTFDNLRLISRASGLGDTLGAGRAARRHFKVYLRHAADFDAISAAVQAELVRPDDQVSYVQADICRRELNLEIEATIFGAAV